MNDFKNHSYPKTDIDFSRLDSMLALLKSSTQQTNPSSTQENDNDKNHDSQRNIILLSQRTNNDKNFNENAFFDLNRSKDIFSIKKEDVQPNDSAITQLDIEAIKNAVREAIKIKNDFKNYSEHKDKDDQNTSIMKNNSESEEAARPYLLVNSAIREESDYNAAEEKSENGENDYDKNNLPPKILSRPESTSGFLPADSNVSPSDTDVLEGSGSLSHKINALPKGSDILTEGSLSLDTNRPIGASDETNTSTAADKKGFFSKHYGYIKANDDNRNKIIFDDKIVPDQNNSNNNKNTRAIKAKDQKEASSQGINSFKVFLNSSISYNNNIEVAACRNDMAAIRQNIEAAVSFTHQKSFFFDGVKPFIVYYPHNNSIIAQLMSQGIYNVHAIVEKSLFLPEVHYSPYCNVLQQSIMREDFKISYDGKFEIEICGNKVIANKMPICKSCVSFIIGDAAKSGSKQAINIFNHKNFLRLAENDLL